MEKNGALPKNLENLRASLKSERVFSLFFAVFHCFSLLFGKILQILPKNRGPKTTISPLT
jgi:hypothetical protein